MGSRQWHRTQEARDGREVDSVVGLCRQMLMPHQSVGDEPSMALPLDQSQGGSLGLRFQGEANDEVRIISNDKVKIEDITVFDFVSTKFQTEIIAMNWSGKNLQLQFFDTTGKLVKAKDVGELDKDQELYGVTYDSTGKVVATWANKKAVLLDSKGLKTAPIRGESVFGGWSTIGQQFLLLASDGTAFHIRLFNATKFEFGEGYSIGSSGTGPAIQGIVNTLVVGQDLLFFFKDYKNTKKVVFRKLAHPENF